MLARGGHWDTVETSESALTLRRESDQHGEHVQPIPW
jgi:hypothetical protein